MLLVPVNSLTVAQNIHSNFPESNVGILRPSLRELLASSLAAEAHLPTSEGWKHRWGTASWAVGFMGMVPGGAGADGSPGELYQGGFRASQPAALCLLYTAGFSFQHNLTIRGSGSLKLRIGSLELDRCCRGCGKSHLQPLSSEVRTGTHQLGAFVGAIACEDEGVLSRGNGHHRRVDQAQLHDAGVVASQGGCVVEADPRGVVATWWPRGQGCKSPREK